MQFVIIINSVFDVSYMLWLLARPSSASIMLNSGCMQFKIPYLHAVLNVYNV